MSDKEEQNIQLFQEFLNNVKTINKSENQEDELSNVFLTEVCEIFSRNDNYGIESLSKELSNKQMAGIIHGIWLKYISLRNGGHNEVEPEETYEDTKVERMTALFKQQNFSNKIRELYSVSKERNQIIKNVISSLILALQTQKQRLQDIETAYSNLINCNKNLKHHIELLKPDIFNDNNNNTSYKEVFNRINETKHSEGVNIYDLPRIDINELPRIGATVWDMIEQIQADLIEMYESDNK